jgi:Domain of unknown function (DUF1929)
MLVRLKEARAWRIAVAGCATALIIGGGAAGSSAQLVGTPNLVGQWTLPFEEGGVGTPRCVPAQGDTAGFMVCKPTAQAAAVLPDGRVFYYNGIESQENARGPSAMSLSPSSRNSQARVLDLRSGTPRWVVPAQDRGGQTNPNIQPGHKWESDPIGAAGVPGRPGDGFVGSAAGMAGVPPHDPTSTPDDTKTNNSGDMFCADLTLLPDGRVLVAGGTDWYDAPSVMERNRGDAADVGAIELEGLRNANLFDYRTDSFSQAQPMKYGRWYPHVAIGADGKPTVFSGVTRLINDTQLGQVRRTETFDPATNSWSENYSGPQSENSLPLQPRIILTPDGKFFYTGVGQMWGPFGEAADEATFALQQSFDPATKRWEVKSVGPLGARSGAFVVPLQMKPPYSSMDILAFGGVLGPPPGTWLPANPFSTITSVDKNGNVANRLVGNLNHARWFASGVLLPDGQVVAVGGADKDEVIDPGTEVPVHIAELYNPATGKWTDVAAHQRDRTYHNSALLLPDMRVLLGGHAPIAAHYGGANSDQGGPFSNNDNDPSFELWSPPYLFRGARPSITRAQAGISYGEAFTVGTPQAGDIDSVVLMRMPSPEHVNDSDQRNLALDFHKTSPTTLAAVAPPSGDVAPPGYYYLVVNKKSNDGPIPSVARIVRLGAGFSDRSEALQPFPDDAPAPVGGSATPLNDSSTGARGHQSLGQAAKSLPAPAAQPATAAVSLAGRAYQELKAAPAAGRSNPAPAPLLPVASGAGAGAATLTARRWLLR